MTHPPSHAGAVLTIDLDAIAANYRLLCERAGRAAVGAAVKADAYGLGAQRVAPVLAAQGCRHFFVAHLDEGIALRPWLPHDAQIHVLHGPPPGTEEEFLRYRLVPVLNSMVQLSAWRRLARQEGRALPAIVQVDTGMCRLGMPPAEVDAWLDGPAPREGIDLRYLMSHLGCADVTDHPMNRMQLERFRAVRARLPGVPCSFANSSGIFLGEEFTFDLARPGAALYGIAPVDGLANPMHPVVRLQGRIIQSRTVAAGDCVGYGARHRCDAETRIATVAVGYADGWLRSGSGRGVAHIDGVEVRQVGTVSMDTATFDVSAIDPARVQPGMTVDLISPSDPVDAVAARAGTIAYEILTSLGTRFAREYRGGTAAMARCA